MGPCPQVECKIALHSRLRHRNIVAFYRHFADHVYVVVEFCSRQVGQGGARIAHVAAASVCGHPLHT